MKAPNNSPARFAPGITEQTNAAIEAISRALSTPFPATGGITLLDAHDAAQPLIFARDILTGRVQITDARVTCATHTDDEA